MPVPVLTGAAPTVGAALLDAAAAFGDRTAFVEGDRRLTFREWARAAAGVATALRAAGARPGDVVCMLLPSSVDFAITYAAAAWIGVTVTAADPRLGPVELEGILAKARPSVTVGAENSRARTGTGGTRLTLAEIQQASQGPEAPIADAVDVGSPAVIAWTSGTTGDPKGAWFSHRALAAATRQSGLLSAPHDRRLMSTPFAHVGFLARVRDQIDWGITAVLTPLPWRATDMVGLLESERITVGQGVPTQWEKVLAHPDFDGADLSALRVVATGATRVPPELVRELRRRLGCPVLVRFACTEVPVATSTAPDDPPETAAEAVGRPAAGVEVRVVDERGALAAPGTVGRLQLRSPGAMSGYWDDPAATARARDADGWIDSGDLGSLTAMGDLVIAGRRSEMYIRGGYNVHPLEVERTLLVHPGVADAAVLGVDAPVVGEVGIAFVVASAGATPDPEELRTWLRERLADFKVPDRIELVHELPRGALSKVDKKVLRARAEQLAQRTP